MDNEWVHIEDHYTLYYNSESLGTIYCDKNGFTYHDYFWYSHTFSTLDEAKKKVVFDATLMVNRKLDKANEELRDLSNKLEFLGKIINENYSD